MMQVQSHSVCSAQSEDGLEDVERLFGLEFDRSSGSPKLPFPLLPHFSTADADGGAVHAYDWSYCHSERGAEGGEVERGERELSE